MNRNFVTLAVLSSLAVSGTGAVAATSTTRYVTPPDSFLQYPVYSVSQLLQQIQSNPAVRARYAQHFQMPANQIVPWMRKNLVESWVPQTQAYTVYCVDPSGRSFYVKQTFHKGTKVFALHSGVPLMKWICGNPLMGFTQQAITSRPVLIKEAPSLEQQTPAMQVAPLIANGSPEAPLLIPGNGATGIPLVASGGGISPLYALGALPLLGFFSHGGGGGGGTVVTPHGGAVVPEPNAAALFLGALPFLMLRAVRRRRTASRS